MNIFTRVKNLCYCLIIALILNIGLVLVGSNCALAASPASTPSLLNLRDAPAFYTKTASSAKLNITPALPEVVALLVQSFLGLIGMIFMIFIIYGGFLWMTAAGTDEKVVKAKKLIVSSVIGLAIVMAAFAIATFIIKALGVK